MAGHGSDAHQFLTALAAAVNPGVKLNLQGVRSLALAAKPLAEALKAASYTVKDVRDRVTFIA